MIQHRLSDADRAFLSDFEACRVTPAAFDHRAHVRLAYGYLVGHDSDAAATAVRTVLQRFIRHHGVEPAKYHETLTRAWVLAVRHFMELGPPAASAEEFIAGHPALLDPKIMLTHYTRERLFSPEARAGFLAPDLDPIPPAPRLHGR